MKRFIHLQFILFIIIIIFGVNFPARANDAVWNGYIEIGSGPDPEPEPFPIPPDPPICGHDAPECQDDDNKDKPNNSDADKPENPDNDCPESKGSPIYMQNGCYIQQFIDARYPSKGPWLSIARAYNSQDIYNGIFGYGWVSHNSMQLFYTSDGSNKYVIIRLGDGRRASFIENDDGSYSPVRVLFDFELTGSPSAGWILNEKCPACGSAGGPRMEFNADGFISSISDKSGNAVSFNYDSSTKRLVSVSDAEGNQLIYSYNSRGKVIKIDTPAGNSFNYLYDNDDNLIGVINPLNATNRYVYDSSHRLVAIVNPEGQVTVQIEYDSINRVTRYTEFGATILLNYSVSPEKWTEEIFADNSKRIYFYNDMGVITKIEYKDSYNNLIGTVNYSTDAQGNITSRTDINGNTTTYVYDDNGNVIQKTDATGALHQYEYDSNHRITKYTDPLGRITTYTYNGNGQITRIDYPLSIYETFSYNVDGMLETHRMKNGITFSYAYDANGNITNETETGITGALTRSRSVTYNVLGQRLSETDANGNTTYYEYDLLGNLIRIIYPLGGTNEMCYNLNNQLVCTKFANGAIISNEYDLWARPAAKLYNNGYFENYSYNSRGLLEYTITPGRTNFISYDTFQKISAVDVNGYTIHYERDGLGNLVRKYDSIGDMKQFVYDGVYRVTQKKNGIGNTTYFYYDSAGNKIAEKDPNGNVTSNFFDALNRVVKKINPLGGEKSFAYDQYSRVTSETNELGGVISYTYDDLNRVIRKDYSDGSFESFSYDNNNNVISKTEKNGAVFHFTYNANNDTTSIINPDGSFSSNVYNNFGRIVEEIDAEGNSKKYSYNTSGLTEKIISSDGATNLYEYNLYDKQVKMIDPLGHYFYNDYDSRGRLIRKIKKVGDNAPTPDSDDWVMQFVYDARGRILKKIENGVTNSYTYNLANKKLSITYQLGHSKLFAYDANGNKITETLPNGAVIHYSYNGLNKLTQKSDDLGVLFINEYNNAGLITKKTIQGNITTTFDYDSFGRKITEFDGYSNASHYVYYPDGKLKFSINRKNQTNTFYYDDFGRVTAMYDGNNILTRSNVYNSIGLVTQKIDAKGNVTSYEYDAAGRMIKLTHPDGSFISQTYDLNGNRKQRTDEEGNIISYEYNDLNQLVKIDYPGDNDSFFSYNLLGKRTSISNSVSVTYFTYDSSRRITSARQDNYLITYEGAPSDNWIKINYPSGKILTKSLDARRRSVSIFDNSDSFLNIVFDNNIINSATNGNGWSMTPAFGANFELTNLVYKKDSLYGIRYSFIRDKIDQKNKIIDNIFPSNSFVFAYDNAQRLTAFQKGVVQNGQLVNTNFYRLFALDSLANITNLITDSVQEPRAYNILNQITNIQSAVYRYDKRGNLTNDGSRSYFYNYENQLVAIEENGTILLSNVYDAAARLVKLITTNEARYFVYDGENIIEEYLDSNPAAPDKTYILSDGIDSLIAYQHGGHTYYYQVDDNQNILVVTDENGDIVEKYDYSPYGEPTFLDSNNVERTSSAINNSRLYTGRRWLPDVGLYYYRARFYSPTLKRFISRDPAGDVDTLNLYLYVYANPVNLIDPLGLMSIEGKDGYPKVEKDGDCVTTTYGFSFEGRKIPIMKKLFPNPAEIALEYSQKVCNKCCPKDSKHPGQKWPSISYGISLKAEVSTGYIPVPGLSITIPKVTTIGLSVMLKIEGSVGIKFGYDGCYDSYTGGADPDENSIAITAGACIGAGSCEESEDEESAIIEFSLTLVAEMTGKLKVGLYNAGNGFVFSVDICFEGKLAANAEVTLFWGWAKAGHEVTLFEIEEKCVRAIEKKW